MISVYPHLNLITDPLFPRIKVDVAQTGFYAGREFRTFHRLSIPTGETHVIKAVVSEPVILFGVSLSLGVGEVDMETRAGGVEGGVFAETLPIFNRNNIPGTPTPDSGVELTAGGTHSGGVILDALIAKTGANDNFSSSVGSSDADERGIGVGAYYFVIANTDGSTADGLFKLRWQVMP